MTNAMTKTILCCGAVCLAASTVFAELSKEEVKRLDESAAVLTELRDAPDKGIPVDLWEKARCVVVIPSLKKAAFVFGGEYGAGVMSRRHANTWSPPLFMKLAKGSWGLQLGAEQVDVVLIVMNERGVEKLLQDKVSLGTDASVAAGPVGRAANAATDAQLHAEMLAYSRAQGLFAGIDISGGVLQPDQDSNTRAYGSEISPRRLIDESDHVAVPAAARQFVRSLARDVRATTGRK